MDADVITFEARRSDLSIIKTIREGDLKRKSVLVFMIFIRQGFQVFWKLQKHFKMLEEILRNKLWVNPDCGLKTRGNEETISSLENLVIASKGNQKEFVRMKTCELFKVKRVLSFEIFLQKGQTLLI